MNERTQLNCGCVWKTSALRTVPPNTEVCLQRLRLRGKKQILARVIGIQKEECG